MRGWHKSKSNMLAVKFDKDHDKLCCDEGGMVSMLHLHTMTAALPASLQTIMLNTKQHVQVWAR